VVPQKRDCRRKNDVRLVREGLDGNLTSNPCAMRISPTIAYSGPAYSSRCALGAGRGCVVRLFADGNGGSFALDSESLPVAALRCGLAEGATGRCQWAERRREPVFVALFVDVSEPSLFLERTADESR